MDCIEEFCAMKREFVRAKLDLIDKEIAEATIMMNGFDASKSINKIRLKITAAIISEEFREDYSIPGEIEVIPEIHGGSVTRKVITDEVYASYGDYPRPVITPAVVEATVIHKGVNIPLKYFEPELVAGFREKYAKRHVSDNNRITSLLPRILFTDRLLCEFKIEDIVDRISGVIDAKHHSAIVLIRWELREQLVSLFELFHQIVKSQPFYTKSSTIYGDHRAGPGGYHGNGITAEVNKIFREVVINQLTADFPIRDSDLNLVAKNTSTKEYYRTIISRLEDKKRELLTI
jgi:hypothetical protein